MAISARRKIALDHDFRFAADVTRRPPGQTSAVSILLIPASSQGYNTWKDTCSSIVQPNILPPEISGAVCNLLPPRLRYSIAGFR